jgi:hypothetical protein
VLAASQTETQQCVFSATVGGGSKMSSGETRISRPSDMLGEQVEKTAAGEAPRLGRLRRVDAGDVWAGGDLAPWLRASPDQLAETLRLEIRPGEGPLPEEAIGELTAGVPVVVKSRFQAVAESDVRDLAGLVADLDAGVLVLLGQTIDDALRQRLSKLNANTTRAIVFYGVEFELWQIDDSAPAPLFKVVAGPDGWDRMPEHSSARETAEPAASTSATSPSG